MLSRLKGIGVAMREALPPPRLAQLAVQAEDRQLSSLWLPEFAVREAFAQLGFVAAHTSRINLATGVASVAARSPVLAAMAASTVDALSAGRAILGLGVSHPGMNQGWHGQRDVPPLRWAEEYLTVVRQVLRGEPTDVEGNWVHSSGFRLSDPPAPGIPVVLAALGPRMVQLAARLADGVLLNWTTSAYAGQTVRRVAAVAKDAGREPAPVGAYLRVVAGPDARRQAVQHTAFYATLNAYVRSLQRMGMTAENRLAEQAAEELILSGDPDAVVERALAWVDAGIDPLVLYPIGDTRHIDASTELALEVGARLVHHQDRKTVAQ